MTKAGRSYTSVLANAEVRVVDNLKPTPTFKDHGSEDSHPRSPPQPGSAKARGRLAKL
jgi:hypothetical protein